MTLPSMAALLSQQQTNYENVEKACQAVEGCVGATIWEYTDKVRITNFIQAPLHSSALLGILGYLRRFPVRVSHALGMKSVEYRDGCQ